MGIAMLLLMVELAGCAAAPPPWHGGFLDGVSQYYDQGTGGGSSLDQADRNARIALVGYRQGIQVESLTQDKIRSFQKQGEELIVEVMTQQGLQQVSGKLPPGSYIAERWQDGNGMWWSFALVEKPGTAQRIQDLRNSRLQAARMRSFVPGWAQFSKGQKHKGWAILGAGGVGLVGWTASALLESDYRARRDRARTASGYDFYSNWTGRFYWGSVGFGTLAGAAYLYSAIDGITSVPPTYRLLSKVHWNVQPRPEGMLVTLNLDLR